MENDFEKKKTVPPETTPVLKRMVIKLVGVIALIYRGVTSYLTVPRRSASVAITTIAPTAWGNLTLPSNFSPWLLKTTWACSGAWHLTACGELEGGYGGVVCFSWSWCGVTVVSVSHWWLTMAENHKGHKVTPKALSERALPSQSSVEMLALVTSFPFPWEARLFNPRAILNMKTHTQRRACGRSLDQHEEIYPAWQLPLFHKD